MPAPDPVLYVAGDVHLRGDEGMRPPFLDFLAHLAAAPPRRLVLLGDLFEYWLDTPAASARYRPVLEALRGLARMGWRLDLVLGNRELAAGRRLGAASGCTLHWPSLDVMVGGRRVRIVHGDRLCQDPGYRFFSAWMHGFWIRTCQALLPGWCQDVVARWLRRHSRGVAPATGARRARVFIDRRRVQAAGRGVDTVIAGHIHDCWRRCIGGVDVMLVGDWPGRDGHWIVGSSDGTLTPVACVFPVGAASRAP